MDIHTLALQFNSGIPEDHHANFKADARVIAVSPKPDARLLTSDPPPALSHPDNNSDNHSDHAVVARILTPLASTFQEFELQVKKLKNRLDHLVDEAYVRFHELDKLAKQQ